MADFYYKNISGDTQMIAILSNDGSSISHIPLLSGSNLDVNVSLDHYVPHILHRFNGVGVDISNEIVKQRTERKAVVKEPAEVVIEEPVIVEETVVIDSDTEAPIAEVITVTKEAPKKEAKNKKVTAPTKRAYNKKVKNVNA